MKLTAHKTRLNAIAHKKLWTLNPGIKVETKITIKPLMIKVNKPNVRILNGNVKNSTIGLTNVLTIAKAIETTIAVKKLSILTPGSRYPATKTAKPLIRRFNNKLISKL